MITAAVTSYFELKAASIILESKQIFSLSVWEEEVFEPTNEQPPQQEPNQRRHTRNRSHKSKIQYCNSRNTGRKVKTGNRPMRRHENSKSSFGQGGEEGSRLSLLTLTQPGIITY